MATGNNSNRQTFPALTSLNFQMLLPSEGWDILKT